MKKYLADWMKKPGWLRKTLDEAAASAADLPGWARPGNSAVKRIESKHMPCYDPYRDEQDPIPSAALCGILRVLETQGTLDYMFNAVDYQRAGISESALRKWWIAHKACDRGN